LNYNTTNKIIIIIIYLERLKEMDFVKTALDYLMHPEISARHIPSVEEAAWREAKFG